MDVGGPNEDRMSTDSHEQTYQVYSPRTPRQKVTLKPLAPRIETLAGKTIAELWDFRYRGAEIYKWLEAELKNHSPGVQFVSWKEFGSTHGSNEREVVAALPGRLKALGVDAVISGVGA